MHDVDHRDSTPGYTQDFSIDSLTRLQKKILEAHTFEERLGVLCNEPAVHHFLKQHDKLRLFLETAHPAQAYVLLAVIAIGQGPIVLHIPDDGDYASRLAQLADTLLPTEEFYDIIGGIIGYQVTVLRLLKGEDMGPFGKGSEVRYAVPEGIDIREKTPAVSKAILQAIENLDCLAEVYVVGGAGDRLDLRDPTNGQALPAAMLRFQGRSLLEGLIRDLQAREYLHYKLYHRQVVTPIAMMTSEEKDNHRQILDICERQSWWGRPRDSFRLFTQPGGPVVTVTGDWSLKAPLSPTLKPGGHGVLWKLARDSGVFDWLGDRKVTKLLIRQVNNPVACTDFGLLAFLGFGIEEDKAFGMASCDRLLNKPEGMSVLIETRAGGDYAYRLSNVEYTEFAKRGIKDIAVSPDSERSVYPANTNILFADIEAVRATIPLCPLPGLLINAKTTAPLLTPDGAVRQVAAGRLETTMQNIADYIVDSFSSPLAPGQQNRLRTFATYNTRRKTLSTTKSSYVPGQSSVGTPEGTFYDILNNYYELFTEQCGFTLPPLSDEPENVLKAPPFIIQLHPAIGPLFNIIAQKIRGGTLEAGAELQMEAAEVDISDLHLAGSLLILCDRVTGHETASGLSQYSEKSGKCSLHRVRVENAGIDRDASGPYWRNAILRHEALTIVLHGNGEFHAADVTLKGSQTFEVADGERLEAKAGSDGDVVFIRTKIAQPTWYWRYDIDTAGEIRVRHARDQHA